MIKRILGEGGYATVFESKHEGAAVAVKKFRLNQSEADGDKEDIQVALEDFRHEVSLEK